MSNLFTNLSQAREKQKELIAQQTTAKEEEVVLVQSPKLGENEKKSKSINKKHTSKHIEKFNNDTMIPRNHDTTIPWLHPSSIEEIRKAVKQFGKEPATHRFTIEEKKAIAEIRHAYYNIGIQTSENQIARIAINFIVKDYHKNGPNSILDIVINALHE